MNWRFESRVDAHIDDDAKYVQKQQALVVN